MTKKEIEKILKKHLAWVNDEPSGQRADLQGADLWGADLQGADLQRADLQGAYLRGAYLRGAYLQGADLRGADLRGAEGIPDFMNCPEEGSFIAWKQGINKCIIKIEIPAKAKRTSCLISRKCRAEYIKTLRIWDSEGKSIEKCVGSHDRNTVYEVGKITKPDKYCDDIRIDCSHGIHFFITKKEAEEW